MRNTSRNMRGTLCRTLGFVGGLLGLPIAVSAAERIGDFSLLDQNGAYHQMSKHGDRRAVVLYVQDSRCQASSRGLAAFQALRRHYEYQGVAFFLLNPTRDNREAMQEFVDRHGVTVPALMDESQVVTDAFGVTSTGEAIIYDPGNFSVQYKGSLSQLESRLAGLLSGSPVDSEASKAGDIEGCRIAYASANRFGGSTPSYAQHVAPVIAENCAGCHRDGGIAPFAFYSLQAVKGWAPMIREVVMTRRMPPGQADPHIGNLKNANGLSPDETSILLSWIDSGVLDNSSDSEPPDPLATLAWPTSKWQLGEPDMIVAFPPQEIPATGVLDYLNVPVSLNLERDMWVRASEIYPGNRNALHHIITRVVPPRAEGESRRRLSAELGSGGLAGYVPGAQAKVFPGDTGYLLRKGASLNLQVHYTTIGKATTDRSEMGIYFHDQPPTHTMSGGNASNYAFRIPPGDDDYPVSATMPVNRDIVLYDILPHMHFRGKRMKFTAIYPDGRARDILSVPNYSFNWQMSYELAEPLRLPAGSRIRVTGAFDNSSRNPFNPDPTQEVRWGQQSWEEMFFGFFSYRHVR
ncbi:MAG: redoxin domain-containing protein [Pseudohongiellaceae bacterium]